ncbi:MAG: hypothetical protein ACP5IE_09860, partial [Infirmifilum sp.]
MIIISHYIGTDGAAVNESQLINYICIDFHKKTGGTCIVFSPINILHYFKIRKFTNKVLEDRPHNAVVIPIPYFPFLSMIIPVIFSFYIGIVTLLLKLFKFGI